MRLSILWNGEVKKKIIITIAKVRNIQKLIFNKKIMEQIINHKNKKLGKIISIELLSEKIFFGDGSVFSL